MSELRGEQRREHFRLRYPEAERPMLRIDDDENAVLDLSEGGARISVAGDTPFVLGQPVAGALRFRDGEVVQIEGAVVRVEKGQAAIKLSVGVSLRRMMTEYRRLMQIYPMI